MTLKSDSLAAQIYGSLQISERHRHRYEVNNQYRDDLERGGTVHRDAVDGVGDVRELHVLAHQLHRLAGQSWATLDHTLTVIRDALTEVIVHFAVYRTYITAAGAA